MKRKRQSRAVQSANKKVKHAATINERPSHALLKKYYLEVVTLRQYLASRLPKKRRRRLQQYGRSATQEHDVEVAQLLDSTLVGAHKHVQVDDSSFVDDDLSLFTQQVSGCDATVALTPGKLKQPEIVDFAVWMLFRRHNGNLRPQHLLCHNYQRYVTSHDDSSGPEIVPTIPGIYSNGPHDNIDKLKAHPWASLPDQIGRGSERIMGDLLIECGLFVPVADSSNFMQICGVPMSDLSAPRCDMQPVSGGNGTLQDLKDSKQNKRGLAEIRFVRHRMFYARPSSNAQGLVRCGLPRIHVLNRCRDTRNRRETRHVMKYMFPLQFGLHNVLESEIDSRSTKQAFEDYTVRETEILQTDRDRRRVSHVNEAHDRALPALPRRLRGAAENLVKRLRKRQAKCVYSALLDHYCPRRSTSLHTDVHSLQQACEMSQVSSFCRAVVCRVFPKRLWGSGDTGAHNIRTLLLNVDHFVRLRKYETLSLHDVLQKMKLNIDWLAPPMHADSTRVSASDFAKRKELMAELLYYLFDSFLVPLIRSHFHVTESNMQRNQLFYFRHDVWKALSEPFMEHLKLSMLEECRADVLHDATAKRRLGVSRVRLVPKEVGMRPIINLRRRVQTMQHGKVVLGRSINSLLTPTFSVLNYERSRDQHNLGSALFSVDDIFPRLQKYRNSLHQQGLMDAPLYFAKIDVQACFDSIPQQRLMELIKVIIRENDYQISKYSRVKLLGSHNEKTSGFGTKPSWKFLTKANSAGRTFDFQQEINDDIAEGRRRAVYINGMTSKRESRQNIIALMEEHIQANLIQVGSRMYRQKKGVPQGSILSTLLCSYFYADMEREKLSFVNDGRSTMLRLIDDFLVISTERNVAERFMRTMHAGIPDYGVQVRLDKSRANFALAIDGNTVPMLTGSAFPYCGNAINTTTLDLSRDNERRRNTNIADSVAVEYSKLPGQTFYRKLLNALKLQMRAMLLSTSYNSLDTVLANLYHTFVEVAQKSYHYIRSMPVSKQPPGKLAIRATDDMIKLACVLMKRRKTTSKDVLPYECCVTSAHARWLACTAFKQVFQRRQTQHRVLLAWLSAQLRSPNLRAQQRRLEPIVHRCGYV